MIARAQHRRDAGLREGAKSWVPAFAGMTAVGDDTVGPWRDEARGGRRCSIAGVHLDAVMPAEAGIPFLWPRGWRESGIPAFAGMTVVGDDTVGRWRDEARGGPWSPLLAFTSMPSCQRNLASRFDGHAGGGKAGFRLSPE
jgi:hypothetical protein